MKKTLVLILLATNLLLAGCWDRREINDLALVTGAGLDLKEDRTIELSLQIAVPAATGGGQQGLGGGDGGGGGILPTFVVSGDGITVVDAMAKLQEKLPRRIFWGHNQVIVIGEELAKEGIRKHLDFFMRDPEPRIRSYVFVCKGKASKLLEVIPFMEKSSAEFMKELSNFRLGLKVTLKDLMEMLIGEARTAALPWVEIPEEGQEGQKPSEIRLNGSAIFKGDKMVGYIDDKVTRGLLWLRNEIDMAAITIAPEPDPGLISFNLIRSKTELIPQIKGGKWMMTVKIVTEDDVALVASNLDVADPKIDKRLEKKLEQVINQRVREVLDKVQKEMKADVFGFAEAFHRKYPKEWAKAKHRWDEIFPRVDVKLDTRVYVRRPGIATSPQGLPEEEVKKK